VDFDTKRPKLSYKINTEEEGNKQYNKTVLKEHQKKRHIKEKRKLREEIKKRI